MALFDDVFSKSSIYDMLFFNVKAVLIHPSLKDLLDKNPVLYDRWRDLSRSKYHINDLETEEYRETNYRNNATYHPEFCRVLAITYASLYNDNGVLKRHFKKITNEDEYIVIATFMDVLHALSSEGIKSTPNFFPIFCGYNIVSYDIPLLIKRFLALKEVFKTNKTTDEPVKLPFILKRALNIKPWESGVVDVLNVWKFNGFENTPLMLICDYLGLKKTVDIMTNSELSQYYWNNINLNSEETLEFIALQSATQTNLVIQLMNELRQL